MNLSGLEHILLRMRNILLCILHPKEGRQKRR